jgi:hypothetical protein
MTLSNFDWTDKTSMKWFIMLPTGHEGPYSLLSLMKRKISPEMKVWAEGLPSSVLFKVAIKNSQEIVKVVPEEDEIPPIPVPVREVEVISSVPDVEKFEVKAKAQPDFKFVKVGLFLGIMLLLAFGLKEWVKTKETFTISRPAGMDPELFEKINSNFKFEGWDKKIFFKEYVPADMSRIWLVTSGFQACKVEALFSSVKGKLLALNDEKIIFKASTQLASHIAEFSNFDFSSGTKIVPGLYEMDLKATSCVWDGLVSKLGNSFKSPDDVYVTRMKVVLYYKGNVEFISILDKLINKKIKIEEKTQNQEELFWQDLQQKLQTLLAITLQIEQLLIEFTESPPADFRKNLKKTVDKYTTNFGHFLTEFVVANEKYFLDLEKTDISNLSQKRSYEKIIRISSTSIGLESMKIIEQLQGWKKPNKSELNRINIKVKKQFELIKENLNQRIIQMTEDRTK